MKWIARALLGSAAVAALIGFTAGPALTSSPNPEHEVTICHAHPADSLTGPWVSITVDVASTGYKNAGHESEHDGDIIPPYAYTASDGTVFTYAGKGDQTILANGCEGGTPSPTPTPSPSPSDSPSPPPTSTSTPPASSTSSSGTSTTIPPQCGNGKNVQTCDTRTRSTSTPSPRATAFTGSSALALGIVAAGLAALGGVALRIGSRRRA